MLRKTTILMHPPSVILTEWKVFEVSTSLEPPTLHLIGCTEHGVRVSSPIFECDAVMRTCMTRSRSIYQLAGDPARILDKDTTEFWNEWTKSNGVTSTSDVTETAAAVFRQVDDERGFWPENMPSGFPKDWFLGALPGAQLKFLARQIDDKFVVGPTQNELQQRYQLCIRLSAQYQRLHLHLSEHDSPTDDASVQPRLADVFVYVALRSWDLSPRERAWIVDKIESMPNPPAPPR